MGELLPAQGPEVGVLAAHFAMCALKLEAPIDDAAR